MPDPPKMFEVALEQERLQAELPDDATVGQLVAHALGFEPSQAIDEAIVHQLVEADGQVHRFEKAMRSTRRAAAGCGFVAGVTFAAAARRLVEAQKRAPEHEVDNAEVQALLPQLARAIDSCTPESLGFALFLFEWGEGGSMFYISNGEREAMIKALQEWIRKKKERGH